jgi:hypothetical protein
VRADGAASISVDGDGQHDSSQDDRQDEKDDQQSDHEVLGAPWCGSSVRIARLRSRRRGRASGAKPPEDQTRGPCEDQRDAGHREQRRGLLGLAHDDRRWRVRG